MSLYNLKQVDQSNPVLIGSTALHRLNDGQPKPTQPMTRERSFKHFYPIPHNGGFIEPIIHIEYEAHDWGNEHAGSIDVLDATLGHFKFVKDNDRFDFIKAVMTDTEREVAQAWLDQTPLDFFHDAAFENECEEWQEPPLSLQP